MQFVFSNPNKKFACREISIDSCFDFWTRISRISRIFHSEATYSFNSFNSCSEKTISNSLADWMLILTRISRISRIFHSQATYSFNSFNSCSEKTIRNSCSVNPISNSCSEKTIRNSCSVKTVRNLRVEKYLLELCFVNMILSHRNHDTYASKTSYKKWLKEEWGKFTDYQLLSSFWLKEMTTNEDGNMTRWDRGTLPTRNLYFWMVRFEFWRMM